MIIEVNFVFYIKLWFNWIDMAEEGVTEISVGEFETIPQLLASSESLQLAFVFLIIGLVVIGIVYRKFSHWVSSERFWICGRSRKFDNVYDFRDGESSQTDSW